MKLNPLSMLPFAQSLLLHLQSGITKGVLLYTSEGISLNLEQLQGEVATYLATEMREWKPMYNGHELLDDTTRYAGTRFLAGVACNILMRDEL